MSELTNQEAASSLAELFRTAQTQTQIGFKAVLRETGITSELCRDSSVVIDTLVGEFAELVATLGLNTDAYPDAADRIQQINRSLYATSAILAEIADYAERVGNEIDDAEADLTG